VWIALAWFIDPRHEHLFNLEKLALVPSARLQLALASAADKKICLSGSVQNETDGTAKR